MFKYRYGDHEYFYSKPLDEMTKKELFYYLKLNRDKMKEDMKDGRHVSYYRYDYMVNEGFMLMEEIKRRNQEKGKGRTFLKSEWRHVGSWQSTWQKYKDYMDECIGFKKVV